jgi:hypothetical protein
VTSVVVAWSAVALLTMSGIAAVARALRTHTPKDATRVTGAGCLTFVSGVVVLGVDLTYEASERLLTYMDALSPPGYVGLVAGLVLVTLGAWLRGAARDSAH